MQYFHPVLNRYFSNEEGFTLEGNQYPKNWISHATPEEILALGLTPVTTIGLRKDDRFYDNAEVLDKGVITITATQKPIEIIKSILSKEVSSSRYEAEIRGVVLPSGIHIDTDRDSQAMVSGALLCVIRNPYALIDWKGGGGVWTKIDKEAIELIADAVSTHVQRCFSAERVKCEELSAITNFEDIIIFNTEVNV